MKWYVDLSFSKKLLLPLGAIMLVMALLATETLRLNGKTSKESRLIGKELLPSVSLLLEADRDLYQAVTAERSLMALPVDSDGFQALVKSHDENVEQARQRINQFLALSTQAQAVEFGESFEGLFAAWESLTRRVVSERSSDTRAGRSTAIDLSYGDAQKAFDSMRTALDDMDSVLAEIADQKTEEANTLYAKAASELMLLTALVFVVSGLVAWFLPRMITRDLKEIDDGVIELTEGGGDLTARLDLQRQDELGKLAKSFDGFVSNLQAMIRQLADTTKEVESTTVALTGVSGQARDAASEQQSAIDMVVTAVHEMGAAIQEVAKHTQETASETERAKASASRSHEVVLRTQKDIGVLANNVADSVAVIADIKTVTDRIGSVVAVIRGIADQTNLLALNAAIEAARAGEQGRGFAVVADEVRALASKTQQSTTDIQNMISDLHAGVSKAVHTMEESNDNARKTVEASSSATDALGDILAAVNAINEMTLQIASAAEEQHHVVEDINRNMSTIAEMSQRNVESAHQADLSTQALGQLSATLSRVVKRFKV